MHAKSLIPVSLLVLGLLSGCNKKAETHANQTPAVTVSQPATENLAEALDLSGTVAASQSVDLVARVPGFLQSINFKDGDFVKAGQVLFVIEPASYEQQLRTADAVFTLAQREYERQNELQKKGASTPEDVERSFSSREQAAAQSELAKLNLSYTKVTAPFSGRMGRRLVDQGNLVGPSANARLGTLQQLSPAYVYFTLNEQDVLTIRKTLKQTSDGKINDVRNTPVFCGLQSDKGFPHQGALDYVEAAINTTTGTLQLRAVFPNEDQALVPGFFVRLHIPLESAHPMLVVPRKAITSDQEGDYVLIVDANNVVIRRSITKGPEGTGGCSIKTGLNAQDRVIVDGLMQARPGQKVTPQSR